MYIPNDVIKQLRGLNCEDVAARYGFVAKGHMIRCFRHEDRVPSLGFKGNYWKCFSCDIGGDAISFVQELFSVSFSEACMMLCSEYQIYIPEINSQKSSWKKSVIMLCHKGAPMDAMSVFDKEVAEFILQNTQLTKSGQSFLFDERKYNSSVIEKSNIHSVEYPNTLRNILINTFGVDRLIKNKVLKEDATYLTIDLPSLIIPYYDERNELVGLQTRYLGKDNRNYYIPRFKRICNSGIRLYNLQILSTVPFGGNLYITEGITDCLALQSSGYNVVAIPSATSIPLSDIGKLSNFNLFMISDQDRAGDESYQKLYRMMLRYGCILKKIMLPKGYKDYSEYYLTLIH